MANTHIDPALIGIWLLPGQPQTYEITEDGEYFIAEPDESLGFEGSGAIMTWGGRRYLRIFGEGETPIGTWREEDTGDGWDFTADHTYNILTAAPDEPETFSGIWALRNEGHSLWTCEKQADIEADGAHLTFHTPTGEPLSYGYSCTDGVLALLDPDTWMELSRYISAERMVRSAAG